QLSVHAQFEVIYFEISDGDAAGINDGRGYRYETGTHSDYLVDLVGIFVGGIRDVGSLPIISVGVCALGILLTAGLRLNGERRGEQQDGNAQTAESWEKFWRIETFLHDSAGGR